MAKKDEKYLNVTLKNDNSDNKDDIIISFSGFIKQLRRFLIFWLVAALLIGILVPVYFAVFTADQHKNLTALVSFNYSGIEKGLAPDGSNFDVNSLKSPSVIEQALTEMDLPLTNLEGIRRGISIEGVIPTDAIDRITTYRSIFEQGNLNAGQKMLETAYFPTQYRVIFNYSASGLTDNQPVDVFNSILTQYRTYFFKTYGFNQALGNAVTALDYKVYDYPEQVDVFDDSLTSLQNYITSLSQQDTTRFRSTTTGYTFSDLSQAIQTVRDVDLSLLSANILTNNITKDKNYLIDYYTRRIEVLTHECAVNAQQLEAISASIAEYQVGSVIIYSDGNAETTYNEPSAAYDELINQRVTVQRTLTTKQEALKDYQKRLNSLKVQPVATDAQVERVEADMAALSAKVNDLLNKTNATANEYYETVYLANAYNILVPATSSGLTTTKSVIKSSIEPLLIIEALLFVLYFGFAFCYSLVEVNRKHRRAAARAAAEDDDDNEEPAEEKASEEAETSEEPASENETSEETENSTDSNKKKNKKK